jgi:PST family polysaccharide transporter
LALVNGSQVIMQSLSTNTLALLGLAYWALVFGGLVGVIVSTALFVLLRPKRFAWPRMASVKDIVVFSKQVLVARVSWFASQNADFVVVGRVLGEAALGAYSMAWQLASMPIDKISAVINQVTPAFFAARQNDAVSLRRYLLGITEVLVLITLPITLGMALVADDFVPLVLGQKWKAAILPLTLLAASTSIRSITPLFAVLLNVTGQSRFLMYSNLALAVLLPIAFYLATPWGTAGIASVWIFILPALASPYYSRALSTIQLPRLEYLRALVPAVKCSAAMVIVVLICKLAMAHHSHSARLICEVVGGAATYGLTLYCFHRDRLKTYGSLMRTLRA